MKFAVQGLKQPGVTGIRFLGREAIFAVIVLTIWFVAFYLLADNPLSMVEVNGKIIVIAFFAAMIANATAVGGGFIFMPVFSLFYGIGSLEALKLALSTQAFGMSSGALNWPAKQILWRHLILACAAGGCGMAVGTFWLPPNPDLINPVFGIASILIGAGLFGEYVFGARTDKTSAVIAYPSQVVFFVVCVCGGFITAWISIGIGEIVALWLLFIWRYNLLQSVATGVCALAFCSILGFLFHAQLGGIPWNYLAFTVPGVILGGRAGAKLGTRLAGAGKAHTHTSQASDFKLKLLIALVILADGIVVLTYQE